MTQIGHRRAIAMRAGELQGAERAMTRADRRRARMRLLGGFGAWALLALLGASCGVRTSGPSQVLGSESHFLRFCTESADCGPGLDCISRACTTSCFLGPGGDAVCQMIADTAACTYPSVDPDAVPVCDRTCTSSADCRSLGPWHACLDSRCRAGAAALGGSTTIEVQPSDVEEELQRSRDAEEELQASPGVDEEPEGSPEIEGGLSEENGSGSSSPRQSIPPGDHFDVCAVSACGGDVAGTWEIDDFCMQPGSLEAIGALGMLDDPACRDRLTNFDPFFAVGTTFDFSDDGTLVIDGGLQTVVIAPITPECLTALIGEASVNEETCAQAEDVIASAIIGDPDFPVEWVSCSFRSRDDCDCQIYSVQNFPQTETYSVDGSNLVAPDGSLRPYCVQGEELTTVFDQGHGITAAVRLLRPGAAPRTGGEPTTGSDPSNGEAGGALESEGAGETLGYCGDWAGQQGQGAARDPGVFYERGDGACVDASSNTVGIDGFFAPYDDGDTALEDDVSSILLPEEFDGTTEAPCVSGTIARATSSSVYGGGIGLTLNSDEPPLFNPSPWDAEAEGVTGFEFTLSGDTDGVPIRFAVMTRGGDSFYCMDDLPLGTSRVSLSDVTSSCTGTGNRPDVTDVTHILWSVPAQPGRAYEVRDFCVEKVSTF